MEEKEKEKEKTRNEVRSCGVNTYLNQSSVPALGCWLRKQGGPEIRTSGGIKSWLALGGLRCFMASSQRRQTPTPTLQVNSKKRLSNTTVSIVPSHLSTHRCHQLGACSGSLSHIHLSSRPGCPLFSLYLLDPPVFPFVCHGWLVV